MSQLDAGHVIPNMGEAMSASLREASEIPAEVADSLNIPLLSVDDSLRARKTYTGLAGTRGGLEASRAGLKTCKRVMVDC